MMSQDNISKHRALVDSNEFQRALDYAQMQYVRGIVDTAPTEVTGATYMAASASLFQRIVGVHEFIGVLRTLSEVPPPAAPRVNDNLS